MILFLLGLFSIFAEAEDTNAYIKKALRAPLAPRAAPDIRPGTVKFPCDVARAFGKSALVIAPDVHGAFDKITHELRIKSARGVLTYAAEGQYAGSEAERAFELAQFKQFSFPPNMTIDEETLLTVGIEEELPYAVTSVVFATAVLAASEEILAGDKRVAFEKLLEAKASVEHWTLSLVALFTRNATHHGVWKRIRAGRRFTLERAEAFAREFDAMARIRQEDGYLALARAAPLSVDYDAAADRAALREIYSRLGEEYADVMDEARAAGPAFVPPSDTIRQGAHALAKNGFKGPFDALFRTHAAARAQTTDWRDMVFAFHVARYFCGASEARRNLVLVIGAAHRAGVLAYLQRAAGATPLRYLLLDMVGAVRFEEGR